MKTRFTSALLTVCFALGMAPAFAGGNSNGPASRTTKVFQQVLKTDNLRILSLELAPGEFLDYHATPDQAAYAASEGTLRMMTPDGTEKEIQVKAGDCLFLDLTRFHNWNTGSQTLKIVLLEQSEKNEKIFLNNFFYTLKP
ncbi:cupin domain-containing protein [Rufibacter quisquiliarum]|uniref:Quercetin dioxygenase-like cupin family protein n=1 Tax=Rufibacter quisquiliarum TaxID=1549639 RepID=A0A839GJM0_9BACT|nr:hypothetical protein [Rufibacter quisquiliarum]MBA9075785.1 quercetin dioxygenase-like cupin family protein [Rufibacter quisquiliarum]